MIHTTSINRHKWAYGILALGAVGAILATMSPISAGLFVILIVAVVASLLFFSHIQTQAADETGKSAVAHQTKASRTKIQATSIQQSDGTIQQGWVVPIEQQDSGYQFVLSSHGYVVTNKKGHVVHRLAEKE